MSTAAESAWVLRQHRRRATPRTELAARLADRIQASATHDQLLARLVQDDELELVECPRWSVANHTEVAISLAMEWKNKALELEQSLSDAIEQLDLARNRSAGLAEEAERNPSPTPPTVGSPAIEAGASISALTQSPPRHKASAVDTADAAVVSSPRWGLPPLGSPLIKRAKRFEEKAVQTSTILGKDVATQSGNGEVYCLSCANLKAQLNHERNRVLFFQNENRRLELREIRSPLEELDEAAIDAEFGMDQPQAMSMQSEDAYAAYDASIHGESLPMMSPALSVVPEGDEQEGEMKQQLEAQDEEHADLTLQEPNVGEISLPDESIAPDNVGYISESPSPPTPPTPPPSPVMPSESEGDEADQPAAVAVTQATAAIVVQVATFAAGSVTIEDEPPGMEEEGYAEMDAEPTDPGLRGLNAAAAAEAEQKAPAADARPVIISTPLWAQARARAAGFTLPPQIDMHGQLLGWMSGGDEQLQRAKREVQQQQQQQQQPEAARRDDEGKRSDEGMHD